MWNRPRSHLFACLICLTIVLGATSPNARAETIVEVFAAPSGGAAGLAWDGSHLWVGEYGSSGETIFKVDPTDGSIVTQWEGLEDDTFGLTWDGTHLRQLWGYAGNVLIRKYTPDGTSVGTIPAPNNYVAGLTWDGSYLWVGSWASPDGHIYQIDPTTGAVGVNWATPTDAQQPWGLAWDGTYLWMVNDDFSDEEAYIYKFDPSDGTVLDSFPSPGGDPRGLTWDGAYLWCCAKGATPSRYLYKIDVTGAGTPDISPSSDNWDYGLNPTDTPNVWTLTITNVGEADLTLNGITSDAIQFTVESLTYPIVLTSLATQDVDLTFESSAVGVFNGTVTVSSDDPDEPSLPILLTGRTVVPDPDISLSSSSHDFGETRAHGINRWTLTLTNNGYNALNISDISLAGAAPTGEFSVPTLGAPVVLQTDETYDVNVDFSPGAMGHFTDTLHVTSNDPDNTLATVPLQGDGGRWLFPGGTPLWWYQGIEDVVSIAAVPDVTGDGLPDVAFESYDAGTEGDHLYLIWGNSDAAGRGVKEWSIRPWGGAYDSGGYGENCLAVAPDISGDGYSEILLATAWGGQSAYCIDGVDGTVQWKYDTYQEDSEGTWVYAIAPVSDNNFDSGPDVVVGAGSHTDGTLGSRSMYQFDGDSVGTGEIVWRYQNTLDGFNCVISAGDVNDDGFADVVGGSGGNSLNDAVRCISGTSSTTGDVLWNYFSGGSNQSLARHNDLNGDGAFEVIVGSWRNGYADGRISCVDGATGTSVWVVDTPKPVMRVDSFADVNGDGIRDVIAGTWNYNAKCYDGATGETLWQTFLADDVWAVSGIPDVNLDGVWDVLAGSFTGIVHCLSGVDGTEIWQWNVGAKPFTLRWIADVNADGFADALVGTQYLSYPGGRAYCLSGRADPSGIYEEPDQTIRRWGDIYSDGSSNAMTSKDPLVHVYRRAVRERDDPDFESEILRRMLEEDVPWKVAVERTRAARPTAMLDGFERLTDEAIPLSCFEDSNAREGAEYEYVLGVVAANGYEIFSSPKTEPDAN